MRPDFAKKVAIGSFLLILFVSSAFALDPNKAITQYVHDIWTIENGLPDTGINSIVQTQDGYLWFATFAGLARFDGIRFTVFNRSNTPILESNAITALLESKDGTLWVGTLGAGIYSVLDGHWRHFGPEQGIQNTRVVSFYEDSHLNLWIGTIGGGLYKLANGKISHYGKKEGLLAETSQSVTEDSKGNLWIATHEGINQWRDGKLIAFETKDGPSIKKVSSVHEDRHGNLWIGTNGAGLYRFKDGNVTSYTTKEGLLNDSLRFIGEDSDGNVWIATSGGLIRMKDGKFSNFTEKDGLSNSVVSFIYEDKERNLWVGTNAGLNRLRDGSFTTYTTKKGLLSDTVRSVFQDHKQNVWIGTSAGATLLTESGVKSLTMKDGLAANFVESIYEDRQHNMWLGSEDRGLTRLSNNQTTIYNEKNGLSGNAVFAFYEDRSGNLWVGTSGGLTRFKDGKLTNYTTKDGLPSAQVRCMAEDPDGNLWIGTLAGLRKMQDGKFYPVTAKEGLLNDVILALYLDQQKDLWIATIGGLHRLRNGKLTAFTARDGLFSDGVGSLVEDNAGNFWICGGGGIFSVNKQELNDFADGKVKWLHSTAYGKADGLKVRGCLGGAQSVSMKSHDGKVWFCTDLGVAAFDPESVGKNHSPPPVIIEKIIADNESLYSYSAQPVSKNTKKQIHIAPGKERFEFHYTALSFSIPERVKFQFMLEGFDRTWIDAGTKRFVEYTNLRPGNYTFKVKACNENGVWNEAGAFTAFYLEPRFYQTIWFYGLSVLVAIGAGLGAHQLRVRQLQEREKKLMAAVEKGTRDLRELNKRLQEAEERIRQMAESGPQALENLPLWAKIVAEDVAKAIGADQIAIWTIENQEVIPLLAGQRNPPSIEMIQRASSNVAEANDNIMAVKGLSGEIYGALVIEGSNSEIWGDPEKNLLAGFAHQLGGALEMEKMRKMLADAELKKAATIQEMNEKGIAILAVCPACQRCYDQQRQTCEMDGAKLVTTRILPYRILNRYRLVRLIGEGGMGIVFHAEDEILRRAVSIKIIHQERLNNPIMRIRMKREAHVLAQIQDPGIIAVYDFGDLPDGSAFLVMEFLKGEDLAGILKRDGPGTPQQVAMVLLQIGHALQSTHSKGVIHRDLKPSNLFIVRVPNGFQVKVLDFGVAKSVMDDVSLTSTGWVVGTPSYMSPEQARNQLVSEESDLFSLAALAYELLTDKRLFYGDSTIEVLSKILSMHPVSLSAVMQNAPQELDALFQSALAKKPEDRPRSVLKWCQQVAVLLQQMPVSVPGWRI